MLSEISGNVGPVLMSLTGDNGDALGRSKKVSLKSRLKKIGKVAKYAIPGYAAVKAAQAAKAALMRKRAVNIQKAKIERSNRARKLAEAKQAQMKAEAEARRLEQEGKSAQAEVARQRAATAVEAVEAQPETEVSESDQETEAPAEETEEIQETSEEGAEEGVEAMGYARSNDDYFVGTTGKIVKTPQVSSQIKVVPAVPSRKGLYIAGGIALALYLFRKQLSRAMK